ncbi:phosphotransferase family protein [Peribacillus sp. SCS-37]|uniref:phosphotransferase family protein n=1 Tax=Paraperibacillus esterisolvens TaxID=3115296 RepID=UPI00390622B1
MGGKLSFIEKELSPYVIERLEEWTRGISDIEVLSNQGWTSAVRKIAGGGEAFLFKSCFEERYRDWLRNEAEVLRSLKDCAAIPVPGYYDFFEEADASHLLMSFEPGITLREALLREQTAKGEYQLIKSFGAFLQKLHEQELPSFFPAGKNWLDEQLQRAAGYLEGGGIDGTAALLEKLEHERPAEVRQTIIHGDCTVDNVLVVNGEVVMFIDTAGMGVGDPRYDEALAVRKFLGNPEKLDAFYDGYTRCRLSDEEFQYFEGLYDFF